MIEIICVYTEMIYQGLVIDFNRQDRIAQIYTRNQPEHLIDTQPF